jgi:hypothetical protein
MVNINCATVGSIDADGTAQMEVLTMHTVVLDASDQQFFVTADPFTYFTLAEEASGSSVATLNVSVDASGLKTALGGWLTGGAVSNAAQNVETYMIEYLRDEINALIGADGVGAALQASVIKDLAFAQYATDAQSGADWLVDTLEADDHSLKLIALQFPEGRFPETFSSSLPAQSGDSLTFQFNINSTITVSDSVQDNVDPNPPGSNNATNPSIGSTLDVIRSRIVHIIATKA